LTYDEYLSLVLSAATAYDNQFAGKKTKRQVVSHELYDEDYNETEEAYDIDAPVSLLLANATDSHNKKPLKNNNRSAYMPKDKWYSLDNKNKEIWDQLDDKAKAIILGYGYNNSSNNIPKPTNASYSQPLNHVQRRQANLHDISAYDLLQAFMHQTDMTKSD
jgi:hypothetical protein